MCLSKKLRKAVGGRLLFEGDVKRNQTEFFAWDGMYFKLFKISNYFFKNNDL